MFEEFRGSSPIRFVQWHGASEDVWLNRQRKERRYEIDPRWISTSCIRSISDGSVNADVSVEDPSAKEEESVTAPSVLRLFANEVSI